MNLVRTNVLSNSASFAFDDISLANCIEQSGFTVIYVTHDSHNWRTDD
jgi:hypothetical protein